MAKWEYAEVTVILEYGPQKYKVVAPGGAVFENQFDMLTAFGLSGWELVSVTEVNTERADAKTYYFKRPLAGDSGGN
ncbi:MAG TPA: hypothetical protein VMN57_03525 [Anaerolineales bacterium]|nr:hypothetical protein [Anaerolineales bacterium]